MIWRPQMVVAEWRFASLVLLTAVLRVSYAPSPRVRARARLPQAGINLGRDSSRGAKGARKSPPQYPHATTTTKKQPSSPEALFIELS